MAIGLLLPLRAAQFAFAIVVVGLSGYVAHWYDADTLTASPHQINFLIFAPVFSIISIIYLELVPRFMPKASHPMAHLAVEATNTLFYFAGFIALAVFIGRLLFCRGSVCAAARADAAFAAFSWMLWTASSLLVGMKLFRGGFRNLKSDQKAPMKEAPAQP